MPRKENILSQITCSPPFTGMNGINFTAREIDIIACLVSARGTSKIASLLSVSPKTVANHIHNIMGKLGCNTRESIIDLTEKSFKTHILRKHYSNLLLSADFKKNLHDISKIKKESVLPIKILYLDQDQFQKQLAELLKTHLKTVGLNPSLKSYPKDKPPFDFPAEPHPKEKIICLLSLEEAKNNVLEGTIRQSSNSGVFFLTSRNLEIDESQERFHPNCIILPNEGHYYASFFELLQKLLPQTDLQKTIKGLKEQYEHKYALEHAVRLPPQAAVEAKNIKKDIKLLPQLKYIPPFVKNVYFLAFSIILMGVVGGIGVLVFNLQETKAHIGSQRKPVRSDFILPAESVLLDRPELIKQLDDQFKEQAGIHTVALVGPGGAGKTTLARQYAQQQELDMVWEINAETTESLKSSFENLAEALAATEEDKKVLKNIHDTKEPEKKEEKVINFVKEHMQPLSPWFLVFDNVENLTAIHRYFPQDPKTWGEGRILLTTRDSNIQNNKRVSNSMQIGELTPNEKLFFFNKIMANGEQTLGASTQEKGLREFLEKIPPLPLDISIAAYYLKATNTSYKEYVEHMEENNKDFIEVQKDLLKESGEYTKDRYNIITLSLQKLINTHEDFAELLLLISVLDSQNIPRDVLKSYKNSAVIDNFLYKLKKYSIINRNLTPTPLGPAFSVHRSTQAITLAYLHAKMDLRKNREFLHNIAQALERQMKSSIDEEDSLKMKLLLNHCQAFLGHHELIGNRENKLIEGELGGLYFHLKDYTKAKKILEYFLSDRDNDPIRLARALKYLGIIYKKNNLKKAKEALTNSVVFYQLAPSEDPIGFASTLTYLGGTYELLGDYERARDLLKESLTIFKNYFPDNHVASARAMSYLGIVYRELEEFEEAKDCFEKSIAIYRNQSLGSYMGITQALTHLGNTYLQLGEFIKAKQLIEESYLICKKNSDGNPASGMWSLTYLGNVYIKLGKYEHAKKLLEKALAHYIKKSEKSDDKTMRISQVLGCLGAVYGKLGEYEKSKEFLEKSYAYFKDHLYENTRKAIYTLIYLADTYEHLGQYQEAKSLLEKGIELYKKPPNTTCTKAGSLKIAQVSLGLGNVHRRLGNYEEALHLLKNAYHTYQGRYGPEHIESGRVLTSIGEIYLSNRDLKSAEAYLTKALKIFEANKHPDIYIILEALAELSLQKISFTKQENNLEQTQVFKEKAINYLKQVGEVIKVSFPAGSPHMARISEKIKSIENM